MPLWGEAVGALPGRLHRGLGGGGGVSVGGEEGGRDGVIGRQGREGQG